jgi:hypothetical protein
VHVGVGARVVAHEGLVRPVDLVSKHVQQHLRVALRAQVPGEEGLRALQSLAELLGVRQIAVVDQIDAERGVYEKRLRLCGRGRARRGVPDVAQAHRPLQGVDRLLVAEDVGDEAVGLVLVELGAVDLGEEIFFFLEEKERMRIRVFFLDDVRKREGEENQKKNFFSYRDHARGVLPAVLEHQEPLVELDGGRAGGLVNADDAALAGDGAAAETEGGVSVEVGREREREREVSVEVETKEKKKRRSAPLCFRFAFFFSSASPIAECSLFTSSNQSNSHPRRRRSIC